MKKTRLTPEQFKSLWIERFASGLPRKAMEDHVLAPGNYIWHVFSWRIMGDGEYLEGDAARAAFDRADKSDAEYLVKYGDEELECPFVTADSLEKNVSINEIYFVGGGWKWTYILTHEEGLGPYYKECARDKLVDRTATCRKVRC